MARMVTRKIEEILLQAKLISKEQLQEALQEQKKTGEQLGDLLIRLGFVKEDDIFKARCKQLGVSAKKLETFEIEIELAKERGDFFTNIFGLKLSLPITELFLKYNLSENVATFMMFATGILGAILLSFNHTTIPIGFFLLIVSYIFDYVDGQIARFHKHCSFLGAVRDRLSHLFVEVLSIVFLGSWLFKTYHHWLLLIMTFILLFWNRFSKYIAHLPVMIYICDFRCHPALERKIVRENFVKKLESKEKTESKQESETKKETVVRTRQRSSFREYISKLRESSYTFNFFTIVLLITSIIDLLLLLFHLNFYLKLMALVVFSGYYVISILDLSYTYLFTDRIYHQISNLEDTFKNSDGRVNITEVGDSLHCNRDVTKN